MFHYSKHVCVSPGFHCLNITKKSFVKTKEKEGKWVKLTTMICFDDVYYFGGGKFTRPFYNRFLPSPKQILDKYRARVCDVWCVSIVDAVTCAFFTSTAVPEFLPGDLRILGTLMRLEDLAVLNALTFNEIIISDCLAARLGDLQICLCRVSC